MIVLNWRRADDTLACALSVAAVDHENIDIIVCDNDSGDGSFETLAAGLKDQLGAINHARAGRGMRPFDFQQGGPEDFPAPGEGGSHRRLWLAQTGRNGGYAFGNNVGMRLALLASDLDYVWILNNDTVVEPGALDRLVERMEADPRIGICGAKVVYLEKPEVVQSLGGGRFLPSRTRCELIGQNTSASASVDGAAVEAELDYVNGAAALVRRALLDEVGLMDDGYFLYWEELDWARRAAGRYRLGFAPSAVVYHRVGAAAGTSDEGESSPTTEFHMTRSKFRYLRLHDPKLVRLGVLVLIKHWIEALLLGRFGTAKALWAGAFSRNGGLRI